MNIEELSRRTVFIVDDDNNILQVVKNTMERHYNVRCFQKPSEVLGLDKRILELVDLFVIDVRIQTKRNGIDLASSISEANKYAPFLLMSGFDPPVSEITSIPVTNVTDFLSKPFDQFSLLNRAKILIMAAEAMKSLSVEAVRIRSEWKKILRDHKLMIEAVRTGKKSCLGDYDW